MKRKKKKCSNRIATPNTCSVCSYQMLLKLLFVSGWKSWLYSRSQSIDCLSLFTVLQKYVYIWETSNVSFRYNHIHCEQVRVLVFNGTTHVSDDIDERAMHLWMFLVDVFFTTSFFHSLHFRMRFWPIWSKNVNVFVDYMRHFRIALI